MTPEFSFVIVTDSHVDMHPERLDGDWWHKSLYTESADIFRAAVCEINSRSPDLVVHCGDITNLSDEKSFTEAARIMAGLRMPYYYVPGNHDTYERNARAVAGRLFGAAAGVFYRVERFVGWRIVLLDTVYWRCKDGSVRAEFLPDEYVDIAVPPEEMEWLHSQFVSDPKTPTLCFTHTVMAARESYPVGRMPGGEEVQSRPVKLDDYVTCSELTEFLTKQHCVKAAFYGHGGYHDCIVRDGMLFCQTAELVSYPVEMRLVNVFTDRLETEVFGLADTSYRERCYVKEWGNDWVAGRPEDRSTSHIFR